MRVTLADATLARQAGRFVWLDLDFDKPINRSFLVGHGVAYTPAFFVLDPTNERATATHLGAMTLPDVYRFLDQGERGVTGRPKTPADAALARGDEMLGRGRLADASAAYRAALALAQPAWPERSRALDQLTWALMADRESQACAETAAAEAPSLSRDQTFARVVLAGFSCANQGGTASWAETARKTLEPLAVEAVALPSVARDDHFQLYQQLMHAADARRDSVTVAQWGGRWLDEIDTTIPTNDDERTALDIARVDAVSILGTPERALAALAASERAMPNSYNASLRLAQLEIGAGHYDDGLAACERGLAHAGGPIARTWLLQTKAEALVGKGDSAGARRALEEALQAARAIGTQRNRERNIKAITQMMAETHDPAK